MCIILFIWCRSPTVASLLYLWDDLDKLVRFSTECSSWTQHKDGPSSRATSCRLMLFLSLIFNVLLKVVVSSILELLLMMES